MPEPVITDTGNEGQNAVEVDRNNYDTHDTRTIVLNGLRLGLGDGAGADAVAQSEGDAGEQIGIRNQSADSQWTYVVPLRSFE
jgi:hypothetical protein